MIRHMSVNTKELTTFKVGGLAYQFADLKTKESIIETTTRLKNIGKKYLIISGGSNVVFEDGIIGKILLRISNKGLCDDGKYVISSSGEKLDDLIKFAIKNNKKGLESLSGIPGNVGGAVVGNAGAYGSSISDYLTSIKIFDGKKVREIEKKDCKFEYRDSIFKSKDWIILEAKFKFPDGQKNEMEMKSQKIIQLRSKKYKRTLKCPGSFFKNKVYKELTDVSKRRIDKKRIIGGKVPAGYLLEEVGANGMKFGGLKIASHHGNLILNNNNASYVDVKKLSKLLKEKVKKKFEILLEEEIIYLR